MFNELQKINTRPMPFEFYTADVLWTDEYIAKQMLAYHLNAQVDAASRRMAFIDQSAAWMIAHFGLNKNKSVIDFGCGPGLYAQRLACSGADVTGVDFSENSLAYARQEASAAGLSIHYVRKNYLDYESEQKHDLISMIMCDFCAMSPVQRKVMLDKFSGMLKPGGQLLLDVYSLRAYNQREEKSILEYRLMDGFWSAEPYYGFLNILKYDQQKVVLDKYTIVEASRTWEVYNWLQYFSKTQIEQEFAAAGLRIQTWMGNVAGAAYDDQADEFAIIAEKLN